MCVCVWGGGVLGAQCLELWGGGAGRGAAPRECLELYACVCRGGWGGPRGAVSGGVCGGEGGAHAIR